MSETQARRYILVLQCNSEIRKAINDGKLENVKLIELICSVVDPKHQKQLLIAATSGKSFEAILKLKKELEFEQRKGNETRGRKKNNINLGYLKPKVAKIIMDSLISTNILQLEHTKQINEIFSSVQWTNNKSIEKCLKKIISILEQDN
jgi:ParB family chromosome partitioning protein